MNAMIKRNLPGWTTVLVVTLKYLMGVVFLFDTVLIYASFMATKAVIQNMQNAQIEQQMFSDLKDAECGQRGYLYTDGDESYLPQYYVGVANVKGDVIVMAQYLSRNEGAKPVMDQLKKEVNLKLAEMDKTIQLYRGNHADAAKALVKTNSGMATTERIRTLIAILRAQERDAVRRHRILF